MTKGAFSTPPGATVSGMREIPVDPRTLARVGRSLDVDHRVGLGGRLTQCSKCEVSTATVDASGLERHLPADERELRRATLYLGSHSTFVPS